MVLKNYHSLPHGEKMFFQHFPNGGEKEPTYVFLNGLSQSTIVWTAIIHFWGGGKNVLLLDNIFQGQSDKEGEFRTFEQHADDVIHLCQSLALDKIVPIGISYGSAIAQRLMVHYPIAVQKAILISTFAYKTSLFDTIGHSWKRSLELGGYELMLDVMLPNVFGMPYFENPIIPIEQIRSMRTGINDNTTAILKLMQATEKSENYLEELKKVTCPTLIIQGDLDTLTTPQMAKDIQNAIPNSRLEILKGKGHSLNIEAIPELVRLITEFTS